jgi:hypothetical protein
MTDLFPPNKMTTTTVYATAMHRHWDNYHAEFVCFTTDVSEITAVFPKLHDDLVALQHGKTLTFRRPYIDHRTPDEFVILRYDVPADEPILHVQFIRWKYGSLTMTGHVGARPKTPPEVNGFSDCVYHASWIRPPTASVSSVSMAPKMVTA